MNLGISALDYIEAIKNGDFTVEEFVSETFNQIKKVDGELHAYLSLNDKALDQAKDLDKKRKAKEKLGSCMGMPIAIKDNICVKDTKTTCASKMLEKYVSPFDATVISRLRKQDALFIGKTNLDEFAMGTTTEFSAYGPSKNPWNQEYVPGGSSGGSAVAVSALESVASLGSDTGGSVRNPASFCSIVGLKPTYGLVSRYGLISYANSIEQIGPMARTVKDTAFLLNVISGRDPNDNTTIDNHGEDYLKNI
ncbi:MAG: amidase, partial [Nitrosopumilaceae archaeon]|nr:amidase [Nitrosopumilaceae archaeon]